MNIYSTQTTRKRRKFRQTQLNNAHFLPVHADEKTTSIGKQVYIDPISAPSLYRNGTEGRKEEGGTDEEASKQQGRGVTGAGRMRGEGGREEGGEASKDSSVCLIVPAG